MAEWVARQTAEQEVGSSNSGIPPLLKHACGEGNWLLCWQYTPAKGVALEVNLRERILCTPLPSVNKAEPTLALKEEMSPEVQNNGISGPTNGHVSNKNFKKKEKKKVNTRLKCPLPLIDNPFT